jgi:hypothetical protein
MSLIGNTRCRYIVAVYTTYLFRPAIASSIDHPAEVSTTIRLTPCIFVLQRFPTVDK